MNTVQNFEVDDEPTKVMKRVVDTIKNNAYVKGATIHLECNRRGITSTKVTLTYVEPGKND